jgi:hypothetical protein
MMVSLKPLIIRHNLGSSDVWVIEMTYRSITDVISPTGRENSTGQADLSEQELSDWAEGLIASGGHSRFERLTTLGFWLVIAAILIARFFVVDPTSLRPTGASSQYPLSQQLSVLARNSP